MTAKFETYLSRAEKSVKGVADNYRKAAYIAIENFGKHGDLSLCQRVLDSMKHESRARVVKRSGFLTWLFAFAPITWAIDENGKPNLKTLVKDKGDNAVTLDLKGALKVDFWTYSANNDEQVTFNGDEVIEAVKRVIKKYSSDRYHAKDDGADTLAKLSGLVAANF